MRKDAKLKTALVLAGALVLGAGAWNASALLDLFKTGAQQVAQDARSYRDHVAQGFEVIKNPCSEAGKESPVATALCGEKTIYQAWSGALKATNQSMARAEEAMRPLQMRAQQQMTDTAEND